MEEEEEEELEDAADNAILRCSLLCCVEVGGGGACRGCVGATGTGMWRGPAEWAGAGAHMRRDPA